MSYISIYARVAISNKLKKLKSKNEWRLKSIKVTKENLFFNICSFQTNNGLSGCRLSSSKVDSKLNFLDSLSRLLCFKTKSICASTFIQDPTDRNEKQNLIVGLNHFKSPEVILEAYECLGDLDRHSDTLHEYLKYIVDNRYHSEKKYQTIFGYLSPEGNCGFFNVCDKFLDLYKDDKLEKKNQLFSPRFTDSLENIIEIGPQLLSYDFDDLKSTFCDMQKNAGNCIEELKTLKQRLIDEFKIKQKNKNKYLKVKIPENLSELLEPYASKEIFECFNNFISQLNSFFRISDDLNKLRNWQIKKKKLTEYNVILPMHTLTMHAEVKVFSYILDTIIIPAKNKSKNKSKNQFIVGCSKLLCCICEAFKDVIEEQYQISFVVRGYHKKCYLGWNFPSENEIDVCSDNEHFFIFCETVLKKLALWFQLGSLSLWNAGKDQASIASSTNSTYIPEVIKDILPDYRFNKAFASELLTNLYQIETIIMKKLKLRNTKDIIKLYDRNHIYIFGEEKVKAKHLIKSLNL